VRPAEQEFYESAVSPADAASDQLQIARGKVYGRQPDYSDAWIEDPDGVRAVVEGPEDHSLRRDQR
jgi:hypothetical protein